MYISFMASPLMPYAFFASLNDINGIFIPRFEYRLCIYQIIWQEGAADQLKRSAYDLRYYLVDRKHNVSTECDAFLLKLINEGVTGLDKVSYLLT